MDLEALTFNLNLVCPKTVQLISTSIKITQTQHLQSTKRMYPRQLSTQLKNNYNKLYELVLISRYEAKEFLNDIESSI